MATNAEPARGPDSRTVGGDERRTRAFKAVEEQLDKCKTARTAPPHLKAPGSRMPALGDEEAIADGREPDSQWRPTRWLTNPLLVASTFVLVAVVGWNEYGDQVSNLIGVRPMNSGVSSAALGRDPTSLRLQLEQERLLRRDLEGQLTERQRDEEALASALKQEQARNRLLLRQLASRASAMSAVERETDGSNAPAPPPSVERVAAPAAPAGPAGAKTAPPAPQPDDSAVDRLMARANVLLAHGDIGAARAVLEQASDAGSPLATFQLAQSYDPAVLAAWGTVGTLGDTAKARELYARAAADGVEEAKSRLEGLQSPEREEAHQ